MHHASQSETQNHKNSACCRRSQFGKAGRHHNGSSRKHEIHSNRIANARLAEELDRELLKRRQPDQKPDRQCDRKDQRLTRW